MAGSCFVLSVTVERHIALHHATGYAFRTQAMRLRSFARYAESQGDHFVRASTALAWAAEGTTAGARYRRLQAVRRFARLVRAEDARHEVPPPGGFGPRAARRAPYIFTPNEISALLEAASDLGPPGSLRPKTYATLFGFVAATGLRISEALALGLGDINDSGLVIRETKFRKSRLVPLHATVRRALVEYLVHREEHAGTDDAVFVSVRRTRLRYSAVGHAFRIIVRTLAIRQDLGTPRPRIHDLRHTFAVRSLEQCTGDRKAVARHMLALSTYLGHVSLGDTYWYLQATPRLLAGVATQAETLMERSSL